MKWLEEALSKVELSDEAKAEITKGVKAGIGVNFVPKEDFNSKNEAYKDLQTKYDKDLADRDAQLETLGKTAGDAEAFKAKLEEAQAANAQATADFEKEKAELVNKGIAEKKRNAVLRKIDSWNPQEGGSDLLMTQVNLENITMGEDGSFIGMDDVLNPLKEKFAYVLGTSQVKGPTPPKADVGKITPNAANLEELKTKALSTNSAEDKIAYMTAKRANEGGNE